MDYSNFSMHLTSWYIRRSMYFSAIYGWETGTYYSFLTLFCILKYDLILIYKLLFLRHLSATKFQSQFRSHLQLMNVLSINRRSNFGFQSLWALWSLQSFNISVVLYIFWRLPPAVIIVHFFLLEQENFFFGKHCS